MLQYLPHLLCIGSILLFLILPSFLYLYFTEEKARKEHEVAVEAGRTQPVTIQPLIDPGLCMGSGSCAKVCPEDVLRLIDGQAVAVNMSACVGHGACVDVCPVDAVELVFGSEERGIDIPKVGTDFQTDVRGVYVAGELGGMGLIANAVEQGVQAMKNCIRELDRDPSRWDVVIVGAGPAGLAAALVAKEAGLRYALLEQGELGGAVRHYPRQKLVFVRPMDFPHYGRVKVRQLTKEELIQLFEHIVATKGLEVRTHERVDGVAPQPDGSQVVTTSKGQLHTQAVLLCLGRRGTPRKLGSPGEDQPKVAYALLEPDHYQYNHLLVVGGGDLAVEAAMALGEQPGNRVWLSYRRAKINRPKPKNIKRLREAVRRGEVELLLESTVKSIGVDRVTLEMQGETLVLPNDYVFVFAGGVLPTKFLQAAGVKIQKHFGKRVEQA